jgi:cob(I)alamin adenosyltransferase
MKIYTRAGDDGTTGLLGAGRVPKHDGRVEAYGTVDELNAALGVAANLEAAGALAGDLAAIQSALFQVGAELATADAAMLRKLRRVSAEDVAGLERVIDRLDAELPALTRFVIPGGSPLGAQLHFARTVCRRAERRVTVLPAGEGGETVVKYLNRLADLLFVMARWVNHRDGAGEVHWNAPDAS